MYATKYGALIVLLSVTAQTVQAQTPVTDWTHTIGAAATEARTEWQKVTRGEELVRGKAVRFYPKPNYGLTTDDNDPLDLTDGKLSSRTDDRIWFNKDAVGWYLGAGTGTGILMVLDLGEIQPVGQIAVRLLGGREQGSLEFPAALEFLASADGTSYHSLQKMAKLMPEEKGLSDFKSAFYLPEEGKAYMFPFVCREPVRARYIAIRATPQTGVFTDQISVLKSSAANEAKAADDYPEARVYTSGLAVFPKSEPFAVTTNIVTPNWLITQDYTETNSIPKGVRLEVPAGLRLLPGSMSQGEFREVRPRTEGMRCYEVTHLAMTGKLPDSVQGPFYLQPEPGVAIPPGAKVTLTGLVDGQASHSLTYPLQMVEIPEVPRLEGFDISLAWTRDEQAQAWPGFLENFRKLGFNYVATFPRYYAKAGGEWSPSTRDTLAFLTEARKRGYGIIYNESAFHAMEKDILASYKAGKISPEEAADIFNQIDGKPGKFISPLYRGTYYQSELKRVADFVRLVQPDHVYQDIEWWSDCLRESRQDTRMIAAWKQSGKSWEDFTTDLGTEVLGQLAAAMRAATTTRKMSWGLYGAEVARAPVQDFFAWPKIYPGIVDFAMPSLYVQGRAADVAKRIRTNYEAQQNREIIPWLTAGTYGEFAPAKMEPMVLEAILNGSKGITYYWYRDFDPLDFYYHARALATLAKFQELLREGKPMAYRGDNSGLHYTCFASGTEALILVGNYSATRNSTTTLASPFHGPVKATLVDGAEIFSRPGGFPLDVPPDSFKLVHIQLGG